MHGDLKLDGWLIYVVTAFMWITLAAALAIVIDVVRRPSTDFGRWGKIPWLFVQFVYLAMGIIASITDMGATFNATLGVLFFVALIQQVSYLLRVVFPAPTRVR